MRTHVIERYRELALRQPEGPQPWWRSGALGSYSEADSAQLPEGLLEMSLGCGNPLASANLKDGETVLDLGCGSGVDALLSAKRVGLAGHVWGLDLVEEMLSIGRRNQRRAGVENLTFLNGPVDAIPLSSASIDVVISNCSINLVEHKDAAFREIFRLLKPGGRLILAEILVRGEVPVTLRTNASLWVNCVGGAMGDMEFVRRLAKSGFESIDIEPVLFHSAPDVRVGLKGCAADAESSWIGVEERLMSAQVTARKPVFRRGGDK